MYVCMYVCVYIYIYIYIYTYETHKPCKPSPSQATPRQAKLAELSKLSQAI